MSNINNAAEMPLFVVPGMPRAGTTFLYHYLQRHPQIFLPFRKEVDYFNVHYHFKGRAWFEELYEGMSPKQIAGDISPACWFDPNTIDYIKEYNPDAKIILSLRDPGEFAVSLYAQKNMSHYDLPDTIEHFIREGYSDNITKESGGHVYFRFDNEFFIENVDNYKKAFGTNILIYDFNFFRRNQLTVLKAIEEFLGLDPYFESENFDNLRINASQRRNVKFLYRLTLNETVRDSMRRFLPREMIMKARGLVDRWSVGGKFSADPAKALLPEEDVAFAQQHLAEAGAAFRALFKDSPMLTGDGRPFLLQSDPALSRLEGDDGGARYSAG